MSATTSGNTLSLSIVIPVYGCAGCLHALHRRIRKVLDELSAHSEIVYVDDRSRDESWPVICELAADDQSVTAIRLSRNFGQHAAITAGLAECRGTAAIVMDCDLQDPPELIPQFWQSHLDGFDIVIGGRESRSHSFGRQLSAKLYTRLMRFLGRPRYDSSLGSFSLISRKVIQEFLRFRDINRHYLFILEWLGFERTVIPFTQDDRFCGNSSYSLRTLLMHAIQGILFQTSSFLKWIVAAGASAAALGFAATVYITAAYFLRGAQPGWTSLAVSIWTVGGLLLSTLGTVGLYVGQVFDQVKGRPLYVIDSRLTTSCLPAPDTHHTHSCTHPRTSPQCDTDFSLHNILDTSHGQND